MNAEQLSKVGSDLVRRCGTRDPFQIANALGINVMDDCENLGSLKGMYCIVKRNRFIFLNKDLSPQMKRIVCAHEIGHDRLHRALAKKHGLQEFVLYDMATKPEYEANIVAAEILLDSDEILEYIYDYERTERLWQTERDQIRYSSSSPTMRKESSRQRWRSSEQRTWEHISGRWRLTVISSRWTIRSRRNLPPQSAVLPQTSIRFAAASTPPDTSMRTILQS